MNIFQKLIMKRALSLAKKIDHTLPKLLVLRYGCTFVLSKSWDDEAYEKLEAVRTLAKSEEHWFEELLILVDEVSVLIEKHNDRQLFNVANQRLKELHGIFDMSDDDFAEQFKANYHYHGNTKTSAMVDDYLKEIYNYFYKKADYMSAHLQYSAAVLCGKAMCKIARLSEVVSFEDHIEALFMIAVYFGNAREITKAMEQYDKAICLAQSAEDEAYIYISLNRKLSICMSANDFGVLYHDLDCQKISAVIELLALCDKYGMNIYELGEELMRKEVSEFRRSRIEEAKLSISILLALQRGDWQTASLIKEKLEGAEFKAYGGAVELSNAEAVGEIYNSFYDSAAREQDSIQEVKEGQRADEDNSYSKESLGGIPPGYMFNALIISSKSEYEHQHPNKAVELADKAREIAEALHSDYNVALSLIAMGEAYESCGKTEEAKGVYKEVERMFREPSHASSDISLSKGLLYKALYQLGSLMTSPNPARAAELQTDTMAVLEEFADPAQQSFKLMSLLCRSLSYRNIAQYEDSENDAMEAIDLILSQTNKRLRYMDSDIRENYWKEINKTIGKVVRLADENSSGVFRKKVYELVLYAKGLLLSSERIVKKAVYSGNVSDDIRKIYEELERYEQKRNPWGTSTDDSSKEYVDHYMQRMRLTCAMQDVIAKYFDFINQDYESIAESMDISDVVIDYYDYEIEGRDRQYVAFVYRKGDSAPCLIKLCKESDIEKIFTDISKSTYDDGESYHFTEAYNPMLAYSKSLSDCVLSPVMEKIKIERSSRIHLIPSGSLHKIPIESLVVTAKPCLIASDYFAVIARKSHARMIKTCRSRENLSTIELFGGLDYGGKDGAELLPWKNLRNTLKEVEMVAYMWNKKGGSHAANIHTGRTGTANSFYELSGKKTSVIHFATHGFFETKETAINLPALRGRFSPMDLSGIVMSNGNEGWQQGSPMNHEGILTASDISKMDLRGTSLIVLSACNSGNGVVRSDGVYGLQRAFKKAGAESILMSLWNESDEAGCLFMTTFYSYVIFDKLSLEESFTKAKNAVRKRYQHPFFWANFVILD